MGQRSATESIAAIVQAFLQQRTWTQSALAERVAMRVPAVKRCLEELQAAGMPLDKEEERPQVYWSVPRDWFPGGVLYAAEDVEVLLRQLARLPRGKERDRLLGVALKCVPGAPRPSPAIVSREASRAEETHLGVVEDAAARRQSLRLRYYSASRGSEMLRWASVHRVIVGPPARFLATCHTSDGLKWFRLDNVFEASLDPHQPFRDAAPERVEALLAGSLDGFYDAGKTAERHSFFVREPEARWVAKNLLEGMHLTDSARDGARVTTETTAVHRLARYVVGLGDAACAETDALRQAIVELAEGALRANVEPKPVVALARARSRV